MTDTGPPKESRENPGQKNALSFAEGGDEYVDIIVYCSKHELNNATTEGKQCSKGKHNSAANGAAVR
jgi:hypothetical protein